MAKDKKDKSSLDPKDYPDDHLVILADRCKGVPSMDAIGKSDPYVAITVNGKIFKTSWIDNDSDPEWNEALDLGNEFNPSDQCRIEVWDHDVGSPDDLCGFVENITLAELVEHPTISLLLSQEDGNIVVKQSRHAPTELRLKAIKVPATWAQPKESAHKSQYAKHVMIMSRGTRGDVQPYVALARGLAEQLNWMVTICTELRYKDFVKSNAKVERGCIQFRPSGGDTAVRIDTRIAKWAMQHKSELMQTAMLARSEREFFDSEPVFFHWAEDMRPDYIIFGFTMANLAMILSEKLKIPILGFILQPTVIPSKQYTAVIPISSHTLGWFDKMEEKMVGHDIQAKMKYYMENDPFSQGLNDLRKARNLRPFKGKESETWQALVNQKAPLVIPINEQAFGGKPSDWPDSAVLTDFIFLRKGANAPIETNMMAFITKAKQDGAPLTVMAFSSMPVAREKILSLAFTMNKRCKKHPRVIALVGDHDKESIPKSMEAERKQLIDDAQIFEAKGAPFGDLFKLMDCNIVHGGLGTTAESLRSGVPTIVTGVLLMDQRFWGRQCQLLGVGPEPVHIEDFEAVCVDILDQALEESGTWHQTAAKVASMMQGKSEDGVPENVEAISRLLATAKPIDL